MLNAGTGDTAVTVPLESVRVGASGVNLSKFTFNGRPLYSYLKKN